MKLRVSILFLLVIGLGLAFRPTKTDLDGAWRSAESNGGMVVLTLADNYLMQTTYEPNRFVSTRGGVWQRNGDNLSLTVEFDSGDSNRVGEGEPYRVSLRKGQLTMSGPAGERTFSRVDEPSAQTPLAGLWRITGRANDTGQITPMQRGSGAPAARKTIKLLTGSRFQWAAINPQTKQFSGTGGGTYSFKDGQYIETIDFFSRDNSRVGRSLTFTDKVTGKEWRHTGQSSTGGKVDEIWSREN